MAISDREISIVIPCLNEEASIAACLLSLADDFVAANAEILVVDGMSSDHTINILRRFQSTMHNLMVLPNVHRVQAEGLNIGITHSRGRFIVRADAHSIYPPRYVERCIKLLQQTGADNVGGTMRAVGRTPFQKAVAFAMRTPFGVGNARFRLGGYSGEVDTVYLGAFRRGLFDRVGGFDSACHPAEDAEFNQRIRLAGGRIFLDGDLVIEYHPRNSWTQLAKQYYRQGTGRGRVVLKHRRFSSWRQVIPPCVVAAIAIGFLLSPLHPLTLILPMTYVLTLLIATVAADGLETNERLMLPLVFATMHLAWGAGLLRQLLPSLSRLSFRRFRRNSRLDPVLG